MEMIKPQYAEESEMSVLSSCLRSLDDAIFFSSELDEDCFYPSKNRALFAAIRKTIEDEGKLDIGCVYAKVKDAKKDDICKAAYVSHVMNHPIAVNRVFHVQMLQEKKAVRQALLISQDAVTKFQCCNGDFENVLSCVKESLLSVEVGCEQKRRDSVSMERLM